MKQSQTLAVGRREFEISFDHGILGQRFIDSSQQDIEALTRGGREPDILSTLREAAFWRSPPQDRFCSRGEAEEWPLR